MTALVQKMVKYLIYNTVMNNLLVLSSFLLAISIPPFFLLFHLDYKLVIICSDEDLDKSHMISKLQLFKRQLETFHSDNDYCSYLKSHFVQKPVTSGRRTLASTVDREK